MTPPKPLQPIARDALRLNGSVDMQFGPRLMRRRPPFGQPPEETESLRNVLSSAPGVAAVRPIELHRKGGYVAVMDFDRDFLDEFINHIEAAGWMNVF